MTLWPFNEHKNLYFVKEEDIHMSSEGQKDTCLKEIESACSKYDNHCRCNDYE